MLDWTLLADGLDVPLAISSPLKPHGASIIISPWGLISMGGIGQSRWSKEEFGVWVEDPVSRLWRHVPIYSGTKVSPTARYVDGLCNDHSAKLAAPCWSDIRTVHHCARRPQITPLIVYMSSQDILRRPLRFTREMA